MEIDARKVSPEYKEQLLYCACDHALEQVTQRGCDHTGDIEEQSGHHPIKLDVSTSGPFQTYTLYDSLI